MNKGNVVLCGPNLTREIYIRIHDRLLVLLDDGPDFHAGKDSAKFAQGSIDRKERLKISLLVHSGEYRCRLLDPVRGGL